MQEHVVKMVHGRGNFDYIIMDMLREIVAKLVPIEIVQRRRVHLDYVSDDEGAPRGLYPNLEPKV